MISLNRNDYLIIYTISIPNDNRQNVINSNNQHPPTYAIHQQTPSLFPSIIAPQQQPILSIQQSQPSTIQQQHYQPSIVYSSYSQQSTYHSPNCWFDYGGRYRRRYGGWWGGGGHRWC